MKKLSIFIFLFYFQNAFGQKVDIKLLKFYKGEEPFYEACNSDSQIYKSDTIIFSTFNDSCCEFFKLKINRRKVFEFYEELGCQEPPAIIISIKKRNGRITKFRGNYYINLKEKGKHLLKLKIIELDRVWYIDKLNYPRQHLKMVTVKISD